MSIRYLGTGSPLVCLAGGPGRSAVYLEDLGGLSQHHQLVLPDARGTAGSDDALDDHGWSVDAISDDIEPLRGALGLDRIDLLAHSAGCTAALLYAVKHPNRLASLVLVAPSPRALPDGIGDADQIRERRKDEPLVAKALAARQRMFEDPAEDELPALMEAMTPSFYGEWTERAQSHAAAEDDQVNPIARRKFYPDDFTIDGLVEALAALQAPVLAVTGSLDCATGEAVGAHIAASVPNGIHRTVHGAGHFPWVDRPDTFRALINDFLLARSSP